MYLTIDTETSGLFVMSKPLSDPSQPRIVQLAATVHDGDYQELSTFRTLIRPDGWGITSQAAAVHGISIEACQRNGIDIKVALLMLVELIKTSRWVIGHNLSFDEGMIQREMALAKASDIGLNRPRLRKVCTMKTGGVLTDNGEFPGLETLHEMLFGEGFPDAHEGLADCYAAFRCFQKLKHFKLIDP